MELPSNTSHGKWGNRLRAFPVHLQYSVEQVMMSDKAKAQSRRTSAVPQCDPLTKLSRISHPDQPPASLM